MTSTKTQTQPKMQTITRYRGTIDGVECLCKNGHITVQAAEQCVRPRKAEREGHEVATVTMTRYACAIGKHRFGHRTEADALKCAGVRPAKPAKPAAKTTAKATAAAGTTPKPSQPRRLRSVTQGAGQRA